MRHVSKNIFLNSLICPVLGWHLRNDSAARNRVSSLTLGEKLRIEQGIEIGKRAQALYSKGVLVENKDMISASRETKKLMEDPNIPIIFEGAFLVDNFAARADILMREKDGWHIIEVKSGASDKKEFIDDMAYTAMVIESSGLNVSCVSLFFISKDYRLGMEDEKLFVRTEHTQTVLKRVKEFITFWKKIERITGTSVKPEPKLLLGCRKCKLFTECLGGNIENHIFDLPRLNQARFMELTDSGIVCIEDIPDEFSLTEKQAIIRNCVKTKKPFVKKTLKRHLHAVSWPAYYLDFETVITAIPLYPDIAPYIQIPTQYHIHECSGPGNVTGCSEYLADPHKDCRKELAKKLIKDIKGKGSIIVYSTFEKSVIRSLSRLYPALSKKLERMAERIIDLEAIIRKKFYHPDFHGSTSIKRTLPVLVPDMSYEDMEIADGESAMAAFAYMALGKIKEAGEIASLKRNLLTYCKQDTLAMVKMHDRLLEFV
jgi:predicted RecB family nuclease